MGLSLNNAVIGGGLFGPAGATLGSLAPGELFGISGQDLWGGGGGTSQSTSSQSSSSGPWAAQQPFLQDLYGSAQNQFQNQSPYTQMAQEAQANRAQAGSPLNLAAGQGLMDTMSGAYMPGGSKYQDISGSLLNQIRPSVDSQFAGGRYGSGLHKQGLGSQLSDKLISNMNLERGNMMQAMGMAPGQAGQDYADINQLAQAGQVPWEQLQNYQGLLGPAIGTSQSQGQAQSTGQQQQQGGIVPGLGGVLGAIF